MAAPPLSVHWVGSPLGSADMLFLAIVTGFYRTQWAGVSCHLLPVVQTDCVVRRGHLCLGLLRWQQPSIWVIRQWGWQRVSVKNCLISYFFELRLIFYLIWFTLLKWINRYVQNYIKKVIQVKSLFASVSFMGKSKKIQSVVTKGRESETVRVITG